MRHSQHAHVFLLVSFCMGSILLLAGCQQSNTIDELTGSQWVQEIDTTTTYASSTLDFNPNQRFSFSGKKKTISSSVSSEENKDAYGSYSLSGNTVHIELIEGFGSRTIRGELNAERTVISFPVSADRYEFFSGDFTKKK